MSLKTIVNDPKYEWWNDPKNDWSIGEIHQRAYKGALFLFNLLGLNKKPFVDKHHRRAYMTLYAMEKAIESVPVPLSSEMSNAELFAKANLGFTEAIDAYRKSR